MFRLGSGSARGAPWSGSQRAKCDLLVDLGALDAAACSGDAQFQKQPRTIEAQRELAHEALAPTNGHAAMDADDAACGIDHTRDFPSRRCFVRCVTTCQRNATRKFGEQSRAAQAAEART